MLALLASHLAPKPLAEEAPREPVAKATIFLPFDFYTRNRDALGLTAEQAREMERLAKEMREPAQKLDRERANRTKTLAEAMAQNPIDPDLAMARFQAVLEAENESKALQFRSGIAMRNNLTSDQLRKLQLLATKDAARLAGGPAILNDRIQQLRSELQKRSGGAPPAVMGQLKQIEQTLREGRAGDAKTQLEQLLRELRQESNSPSVTDATSPASATESPR